MAVYTVLEWSEVAPFLSSCGAGELLALEPIGPGIENTNYLVEADSGAGPTRYVLTLFEREAEGRVAEVLALTSELADRGIPCPRAVRQGVAGRLVGVLREKPAVLVPFVEGETAVSPTPAHLESLGAVLARLHLAGAGLGFSRPGLFLAEALCPWARGLAGRLRSSRPELSGLVLGEANVQEEVAEAGLPAGVIHGDLFLDNVIFDGAKPPGVRALLDFHLAGRGPWVFDLAVGLLDGAWVGGGVCGDLSRAFLGGYRSVRPLEPAEFEALPAYLRRAALRFLCLRVQRTLLDERRAASGGGKDPWELARRLEALQRAGGWPGRSA